MPSILKRFSAPEVSKYQFPRADELVVEEEEFTPFPGTETPAEGEQKGQNLKKEAARAESQRHTAQGTLEYAKVQAEAILEEARERAEEEAAELMRQAREDIQRELEVLREEAREEGYHSGYAEGMASATEQAKAQRVTQAVELATDVNQFLERATAARDEMLDQTQQELCDLAIAVAEKVIRVSLKSSSEIVARMIQGATAKMKRKEWVHIYIGGTDTKRISQVTTGLASSLSALSDHVKIVPMGDDEAGTCIIEMPDEIIDASVSTQLSNIRDIISGNP